MPWWGWTLAVLGVGGAVALGGLVLWARAMWNWGKQQ